MAVDVLKAWRQHVEIRDLTAKRGNTREERQLFRLFARQPQPAVFGADRLGKGSRQRNLVCCSGRNEQHDG